MPIKALLTLAMPGVGHGRKDEMKIGATHAAMSAGWAVFRLAKETWNEQKQGV